MRFMVIVPGNDESEAGEMPPAEMFEEMGRYNEQLANAGVMLMAEGLTPTSQGVKVKFSGETPTVIDGPFAESKELIAGFWLLECRSKEECIEWVKRAPFGGGIEIQIRPIWDLEEQGDAVPADVREQELSLRDRVEARNT